MGMDYSSLSQSGPCLALLFDKEFVNIFSWQMLVMQSWAKEKWVNELNTEPGIGFRSMPVTKQLESVGPSEFISVCFISYICNEILTESTLWDWTDIRTKWTYTGSFLEQSLDRGFIWKHNKDPVHQREIRWHQTLLEGECYMTKGLGL